MSRLRTIATLAALAGLGYAAASIPIPIPVDLPFVLEPHGVRHVYATAAGRVVAIKVKPGQRVREGDVLLEMTHFTQEDYRARLETALDIQRLERDLQRSLQNAAGIRIAEEAYDGVESQLREQERQLDRLVVRAPCDGVVIAAEAPRASRSGDSDGKLPTREGTALDPQNLGAWLEAGAPLLSIAPDSRFDAVVLIDQHDRDDLQGNETVDLKFDHLPLATFSGVLGGIGERSVESVPRALSNKYGGPLATTTGDDGHEQPAGSAFQSTILIEEAAPFLRTGLRGTARISLPRRTAAEWMWRAACNTFHFRF